MSNPLPTRIDRDMENAIKKTISETAGKDEMDIQKQFIKNAPFHRGQVALWRRYGYEIFKPTGRKMFGLKYNDKNDPTIKRKLKNV